MGPVFLGLPREIEPSGIDGELGGWYELGGQWGSKIPKRSERGKRAEELLIKIALIFSPAK